MTQDTDEERQLLLPQSSQKDEIYGLSLLLASTVCSVGLAFFIKLCTVESIPPTEMAAVQGLFQATLAYAGCVRNGVSPLGPPQARKLLMVFGVFGGLLLILDAYCAMNLPLSDFIVMAQLSVVFTMVLAIVLLGEPFRYTDGVCILLCMSGTILLVKPQFLFGDSQQLPGLPTIGALVMAFIGSTMSIITRKLRNDVYFLVLSIYFSMCTLIITLPSLLTFIVPQHWKTYIWLFMSGICLFGSGSLIHRGTQLAPAGPGSIIRINRVIVAIPLGIFVFHEYPDALGIVGTCMIMFGTGTLLFATSRRR